VTGSGSDDTELRLIKEERRSTQKCLEICAQLSDHIDQIQLMHERSGKSPERMDPDTVPERLTISSLQECKNSLALTAAKLEGYMKDLIDRLVTKSKATMTSEEDLADLVRLQEEWDTTRQQMEICSKADTYLKENITTIDNYATGDAVQFMVSIDGLVLHGKNRGLGWRSRQFGGNWDAASLQQVSRDWSSYGLQNTRSESSSSPDNTLSVPEDGMEHKPRPEFKERYGPGRTTADIPMSSGSTKGKLKAMTTADIPMSSPGSAEGGPSSSAKR
jgi:hypothetical protein